MKRLAQLPAAAAATDDDDLGTVSSSTPASVSSPVVTITPGTHPEAEEASTVKPPSAVPAAASRQVQVRSMPHKQPNVKRAVEKAPQSPEERRQSVIEERLQSILEERRQSAATRTPKSSRQEELRRFKSRTSAPPAAPPAAPPVAPPAPPFSDTSSIRSDVRSVRSGRASTGRASTPSVQPNLGLSSSHTNPMSQNYGSHLSSTYPSQLSYQSIPNLSAYAHPSSSPGAFGPATYTQHSISAQMPGFFTYR